jgi:hypothetical protein
MGRDDQVETDLGGDGSSCVSLAPDMAYLVHGVVVAANVVDRGIGVLFQVRTRLPSAATRH